jgi:hypothetical protein
MGVHSAPSPGWANFSHHDEMYARKWPLSLFVYSAPSSMLTVHIYWTNIRCTEVEFLEEIQTEVLRVFLLAIHRQLF